MIWIVEDKVSVAKAIKRILEDNDMMSEHVPSGTEVIRRLEDGTIPLGLIVDIELNGISGNDVIKYIVETGGSIPVIVIAGDTEKIDPSIKDYPIGVLKKPGFFPKMVELARENMTAHNRRRALGPFTRLVATFGDILNDNKKSIVIIMAAISPILAFMLTWLAHRFGVTAP